MDRQLAALAQVEPNKLPQRSSPMPVPKSGEAETLASPNSVSADLSVAFEEMQVATLPERYLKPAMSPRTDTPAERIAAARERAQRVLEADGREGTAAARTQHRQDLTKSMSAIDRAVSDIERADRDSSSPPSARLAVSWSSPTTEERSSSHRRSSLTAAFGSAVWLSQVLIRSR